MLARHHCAHVLAEPSAWSDYHTLDLTVFRCGFIDPSLACLTVEIYLRDLSGGSSSFPSSPCFYPPVARLCLPLAHQG